MILVVTLNRRAVCYMHIYMQYELTHTMYFRLHVSYHFLVQKWLHYKCWCCLTIMKLCHPIHKQLLSIVLGITGYHLVIFLVQSTC